MTFNFWNETFFIYDWNYTEDTEDPPAATFSWCFILKIPLICVKLDRGGLKGRLWDVELHHGVYRGTTIIYKDWCCSQTAAHLHPLGPRLALRPVANMGNVPQMLQVCFCVLSYCWSLYVGNGKKKTTQNKIKQKQKYKWSFASRCSSRAIFPFFFLHFGSTGLY